MKVLVACERSGVVRDSFRKLGHDAWSCDLEETDIPGPHVRGCVLKQLEREWDLIIAHPPCTRICNSGVSWLSKRNLWAELEAACDFFNRFRDHPCKRVAIENPIPHKYAMEKIKIKYSQIVQPWMFGHGETKATCL